MNLEIVVVVVVVVVFCAMQVLVAHQDQLSTFMEQLDRFQKVQRQLVASKASEEARYFSVPVSFAGDFDVFRHDHVMGQTGLTCTPKLRPEAPKKKEAGKCATRILARCVPQHFPGFQLFHLFWGCQTNPYGGFHSHGATPKTLDGLQGKIPSRNGCFRVPPHLWKPISYGLIS